MLEKLSAIGSRTVRTSGRHLMLLTTVLAYAFAVSGAGFAKDDDDVYELGSAAVALSRGPAANVWPGLADLGREFAVVDGNSEVVVCRESAPGYEPISKSPVEGCAAFKRSRVFPQGMQASLNLFGSEETVLVSPPAELGQGALEWTLLFVHERFHQLQSTFPGYGSRVDALDLAGGDETGMWMITHPFPYDDPSVAQQTQQMGRMLVRLVASPEAPLLAEYLAARRRLLSRLTPADRRYLEFQIWKEGAARWTEIAVARHLATSEHPLADEFSVLGKRILDRVTTILNDADFARSRRGWFYAMGAAEWMVVDRLDPEWREKYPDGPLAAGPYLESALMAYKARAEPDQ